LVLFSSKSVILSKRTYKNYKVYKLDNVDHADHRWLTKLAGRHPNQVDIFTENAPDKTAEVLVSPKYAAKFIQKAESRAINYTLIIDDLSLPIKEEENQMKQSKKPTRFRREMKTSIALSPLDNESFNISSFHRYSEILNWMESIVNEYPHLVKKLDFNRTFWDRPLIGVKIGLPRADGRQKPVVFVDGGMHSREFIAISSVVYIVHQLVQRTLRNDTEFVHLVSKFDFHILPVSNPDGYNYTWESNRMWRKTRSYRKGGSSNSRCIGVDPNRNWNFHWAEGDPKLAVPCGQIYAGPWAFSEPEIDSISRHLRNLTLDRHLKLYLSIHAFGQILLGPWGYKRELSQHDLQLRDAARSAIHAIRESSGKVYNYGTIARLLYRATGTSIDYLHSYGLTYSFGFELRPRQNAHISSSSDGDDDDDDASVRRKRSAQSAFIVDVAEIVPTGEELLMAVKAMTGHIEHVQKI
jgi:hypothetical protein